MVLEFPDFERILEELRPSIGNRNALVNLARWSMGRGRHTQRHVQSLFKRGGSNKPLFIFETAGLRLVGDCRDRYARTVAGNPAYEDASVRYILEGLSRNGGAFLDVGTNMGVVAALVAAQTKQVVVAAEPDLETAKRAACAFALNGLRNVVLYVAAVGDRIGDTSFYTTPGRSDAASLSGQDASVEVKVPIVTIDSIVEARSLPSVGVIKIDVEGHEPQAIAGAETVIRRDRPDIFFEYHFEIAPRLGWTAEQVRQQIEGLAPYRYCVVREDDPIREFPPTRDMGINVNVWCRHNG